jgi:hypothetical protein
MGDAGLSGPQYCLPSRAVRCVLGFRAVPIRAHQHARPARHFLDVTAVADALFLPAAQPRAGCRANTLTLLKKSLLLVSIGHFRGLSSGRSRATSEMQRAIFLTYRSHRGCTTMAKKLINLMAFLALMTFSASAFAQQMYVRVTNNTGFDIYHLYLSPASSTDWEDDMLGSTEVLRSGQSKRININGYKSPKFDVKAVDEDGDEYLRMGINVNTQDVVFTLDDLDV